MKLTMQSLSEELHTYLSTNSLTPTQEGASVVVGVSMDSLYLVEFLNILQFSGIANHNLELKVGMPILLLRNSQSINRIVQWYEVDCQEIGSSCHENGDHHREQCRQTCVHTPHHHVPFQD